MILRLIFIENHKFYTELIDVIIEKHHLKNFNHEEDGSLNQTLFILIKSVKKIL